MAQVKFRRIEDSSDINDLPIVDGQIIYTKDGEQYIDYETDRINLAKNTITTLLWTNETPDVVFDSQQITLSSDDYDYLIWTFKVSNDSGYNTRIVNSTSLKGLGTTIQYCTVARFWTRNIDYVSDTTYSISNCLYDPDTTSHNNAVLIPYRVIGVKANLF